MTYTRALLASELFPNSEDHLAAWQGFDGGDAADAQRARFGPLLQAAAATRSTVKLAYLSKSTGELQFLLGRPVSHYRADSRIVTFLDLDPALPRKTYRRVPLHTITSMSIGAGQDFEGYGTEWRELVFRKAQWQREADERIAKMLALHGARPAGRREQAQ